MTMQSRVIPRQVSFVFYDDDPEHYTGGSAQVFIYGDRGFMYGISGAGFFASFVPQSQQFMAEHGLRTLEGYMSVRNARKVRHVFSAVPNTKVFVDPKLLIEGHWVCWVAVVRV